jgi:membrane associated rhomboid family serine protease
MEGDRGNFLKSVRHSILPPFIFICLLWILKWIEWSGYADLTWMGVYPRTVHGLIGIATAPLVHGDFGHLFANCVPLFALATAILFFYRRRAWLTFLIITIGSGAFVWIFGKESYHIGASGLVYGCAAFLVASGFINKDPAQISLSLLVFLFYGSMIWGVLPIEEGVSWEAHLGGLIVGLLCALIFKQPKQPAADDENDIPEKPRIGEYIEMKDEDTTD